MPFVDSARGRVRGPVGLSVPGRTIALARRPAVLAPDRQAKISELAPYYLAYAKLELRLSPQTLQTYEKGLLWSVRIIGDITPEQIRREHFLLIKARLAERQLSNTHVAVHIYALKSFLKFCRLVLNLEILDLKEIRAPRHPRREVVFLKPEEIQKYVSSIPIFSGPRTINMQALCFRVLVEVLLATGMRISEALSLTRKSINLETGEAKIIGKGNKERVVFFNPRALGWIKEFINHRRDDTPALFVVSHRPWRAANRDDAIRWFSKHRRRAGLSKKVTAHILRHTFATTLLFNGCPIGHITNMLGHDNIATTCRYYLGTDTRAAKAAHSKFLQYDTDPAADPTDKAKDTHFDPMAGLQG